MEYGLCKNGSSKEAHFYTKNHVCTILNELINVKVYQTQNALNMVVSSRNPQKLSIAYSDK